jgi:membrane protein YqaA with SNARE-associated domain
MGGIAHWLTSLPAHVQALALGLGAPGLFLVTFLDSSFLSLPEVADLLVVWMVTQHKTRFLAYAAGATAGSIVGCLLIYYMAKKGGEALLRKHFSSGRLERARAALQRHGLLAVLIPSLLPPPAPFKIFVLLAGVAEISAPRFAAAIAIGRGGRYFLEALLALWYGDRAIAFIQHNTRAVLSGLLVLIALGALGCWVRSHYGTQQAS